MRIPIRVQLGLLVLLCSLMALMVLAIAVWFQNYHFVTNIRLSGLSLTASLKAAQISSYLLLYQSSVQSISTRVLIQSALTRYLNGNHTQANWNHTQSDIQSALSSGQQALLLQAVLYPNVVNGSDRRLPALVKVTGTDIGKIQLPYKRANGSWYNLGDAGLGYPPPLYPTLIAPLNGTVADGNTTVQYDGTSLNKDTVLFIGPLTINNTLSLFSVTTPVINNTSLHDILGWLTVVIDARLLYDTTDSPEGLGSTGEMLLVGPSRADNKFSKEIRGTSMQSASSREVHFVLPPMNNATLSNRHSLQYTKGNFTDKPFPMAYYPAVVHAWTQNNHDINNAGAIISSHNEQNETVSVGYATVSNRIVDWIVVIEQSHGEVVSPITHLRDVVLICVFSVTGLLLAIMLPLAHFSVAPIRALRSATQKSVQPYIPEGSSECSDSSRSGEDSTEGDEANLTALQEAKKEGFLGFVGKLTRKKAHGDGSNRSNTASIRRRTFRIPGKVPERKHFIYDELTDLTRTFNEMSDELVMQYERLEERVTERTAQLEQSKKAAEVANESKTLFIANISHELKTPLNGILGLCAVCMQEDDIHRVRSTLGTIYKSGDLLLHLLTDLLTFSKNSIGQQLAIDETEFRLGDLSTQLMPTFEKQAREAQVDLQVHFEGTTDAFGNSSGEAGPKIYGPSGTGRVKDMTLWGDKNRILQVLMNFTSNSLKFTPPNGSVTVRLRCIGLQQHFESRMSSTRKTSFNSKKSKNSKSSSKHKVRTSETSLALPNTSDSKGHGSRDRTHTMSNSGEESKLSINVGSGTAQIAKIAERRRSMSPPPLNTKDLMFEFEVEDTGPGIPEDQQQKIFEPFVQGDLGLSKKYGGTGLGLSICAQLAALMGGSISLRSIVGSGSTFMMQLPLRFVSERPPSVTSSQARSAAGSIVGQPLYDDSRAPGHTFSDSTASLNDLQNGQDDQTPPVQLADVPRIVGFTQPYLAKESKPEFPKSKISEMKKAEDEAARLGRKVRVLVAEDNKINQEVVLRMLKLEEVYDVTIAKDGQEALDKVRASMDKEERFHLIFMDVQMPNLDGIQSTKLIREMGFSAPIVALTAFAEKSNEEECMASGMDYFLPKPIRRPALKQVLKKYCATIPEEDNEGSAIQVPTLHGANHAPPSNRASGDCERPRPVVIDPLSHDSGQQNISPMS